MRPAVKPCGFKYSKYVLRYVVDITVISNKPQKVMSMLSRMYKQNVSSGKKPTEYLDATTK
jgi:transcription initiation factor TFIIIB Brf1 subunit/transcription initiation factor TFIIB